MNSFLNLPACSVWSWTMELIMPNISEAIHSICHAIKIIQCRWTVENARVTAGIRAAVEKFGTGNDNEMSARDVLPKVKDIGCLTRETCTLPCYQEMYPLTSAILVAQVWKSPQISHTNSKGQCWHHKVQPPGPVLSSWLLGRGRGLHVCRPG